MKSLSLRCRQCRHAMAFGPASLCPECGFGILDAHYDIAGGIADKWRQQQPQASLWRYGDLLPVIDPRHIVSLGEGGTPLIRADRLGRQLGLEHLLFKDERQNPTGSFKDRQGTVAVSVLVEQGIRDLVVASTGNVGLSYAAYAARAGIRLHAFFPSSAPEEKIREAALFGARIVLVSGTYDETKVAAEQFAVETGLYLDRGVRTVAAVEGMKTLAFEIAEQLGWRSPSWYIQGVSGGMGPVGVEKGFLELQQLGLVDRIPAFGLIQSAGCAPMARAFRAGLRQAEPVEDVTTTIITLATADPGSSFPLLADAVARHGGSFETATDEEAWEATRIVARTEGISLEPAAAVAMAGMFKMARSGLFDPRAEIVVNCSGHTYPVESHVVQTLLPDATPWIPVQ